MTPQLNPGEFDAIFVNPGPETRPVMSTPRMPLASTAFIREVSEALHLDGDRAREAADWIAAKLERYAMATARPVFDMDGSGPICSLCEGLWPLCGHYHYSQVTHDGHDEIKGDAEPIEARR